MSFSSDLKEELSKINNLKNKQEVYAEFLGYLVTANVFIKGKNIKLRKNQIFGHIVRGGIRRDSPLIFR